MSRKPTKLLRVRLDFVVKLAREIDTLPAITPSKILDGAALVVLDQLPEALRERVDAIRVEGGATVRLTLDRRKIVVS